MQAIISFKTFASSQAAFRASFPRSSVGWGPHGGTPSLGSWAGTQLSAGRGSGQLRSCEQTPLLGGQDLPSSQVEVDTWLGDRAGNRQ